MKFINKLDLIVKENNSLLCIGLDPELSKLPKNLNNINDIFYFNKEIIDATNDLVCAYKPNIAFYEALGIDGLLELKKTIDYLKKLYPKTIIILDAKRGDVPNTARLYAKTAYEYWDIDSVTISPNLGLDSILPYLEYKDRLTIFLIKTSNPDSGMFQDISVNGEPYHIVISKIISKWNYDNFGIFVGATYPNQLNNIRKIFPNRIFLSAGIGTQSADIEKAVKAGIDMNKGGIIYNSSRNIIYGSNNNNFAEIAREKAIEARSIINQFR
ncbi:MAG: orotidine-5'-phosphate decarboxylase [Candidatus Levybacteria bacterium]|nr:orotidine-5'-phosphate decarboxylase [Candidatus Levybacteria bacterium]